MFGIGKDKKKGEKPDKKPKAKKSGLPTVVPMPEVDERIHIMPERFYIVQKQRQWGLIIIITLGILVIGGLGTFAYFLNESLKQERATQQTPDQNQNANVNSNTNTNTNANDNANQNSNRNTNRNTNTNTNTNTNRNVNANTNVNTNVNTNTNSNVNTNVNTNVNRNTNTSANTNTPATTPQPLPQGPDVDGDGLSLAEEIIFATDPKNSDSDGDGFADGSELLNGFDPTKPQLTFTETGLFGTFSHDSYVILYPTAWQVVQRGTAGEEVLFQSAGGEFVEVLILEKPSNQTLAQWYQTQFPDIDPRAGQVKIGGLDGFQYPDNQSYYLPDPNDNSRLFWLTYNTAGLTQTNFLTTFVSMVKTFSLQ